MEMMNLLGLPDPAPTVARMAELGVLAVVLPEARVAPLAALTEQEIRQGATPDALRRLAALLPAEVPLAEAVASRFRLSGAQKKRLATAAGRISGRENPRALAYRLGRESALDRLLLTGESTAPLDGWEIPTFPLKGGEIVARGIKAGPKVARTLQAVEARWIDEGFPGADRVAQLLDAELAANR